MARTRGVDVIVVAGFLAVIFGVGVAQAIRDVHYGDRPQAIEVFTRTPTAENLRRYEKDLAEASCVERHLRPWTQYAEFVLLHDVGDKALMGRDGWFFYKPGVDYLTQRQPLPQASSAQGDPLAAIVSFRDQLAARGIRLLVVPVPNKESIYAEMLTRRAEGIDVALCPETRALLSQLAAAGVEVVDLFEAFAAAKRGRYGPDSAALYLAQDSHWSPVGAELAARLVAQRCVQRGWIRPGAADYACKPLSFRRLGDVLQMLQSPQVERHVEPEEVHARQVVDRSTGALCKDQPDAQVLVLGDSFLRVFEHDEPRAAGFLAHLARELKQPVAAVVSDGGASTLVRQDLYRRRGLLADKRLLIWEFVERDILSGAEGWQFVPLPPSPDNRR